MHCVVLQGESNLLTDIIKDKKQSRIFVSFTEHLNDFLFIFLHLVLK